jgi:DUF4097 and DUF4098 domain-containing protein YvlB
MNDSEKLRIMRLLREGKVSAEEALELLEALEGGRKKAAETRAEPREGLGSTKEESQKEGKDSFKDFGESVSSFFEKLGKDISSPETWQKVSMQVQEGMMKGAEVIRRAAKQFRKNVGSWSPFRAKANREFQLPLPDGSKKILRIVNPCGDVRIRGQSDQNMIFVSATIDGQDADEAQRRAQELNIMVEESHSIVKLEVPDLPGLDADLDIQLAPNMDIEILAGQGDVRVKHLDAKCSITLEEGDVRLDNLDGSIRIDLQNGDIHLEDIRAPELSIESQNGNSSLKHVEGNMSIRTNAGNVSLKRCKGEKVHVEVVSGNVNFLHSSPLSGEMRVRIVNGTIQAELSDASDCKLQLSSLNGAVDCKLKLQEEAREAQRISGVLGNGHGIFDASVVNGYVQVEGYQGSVNNDSKD